MPKSNLTAWWAAVGLLGLLSAFCPVSSLGIRDCFGRGAGGLPALEAPLPWRCRWPLERFFFKAVRCAGPPRDTTMAEALRLTWWDSRALPSEPYVGDVRDADTGRR